MHETNEWTEHSTGLVKVEIVDEDVDVKQDVGRLDKDAPSAPRTVDARAWYKKFLDVGLGYGPAFQRLSNIRTDPESNLSVATVALHPTASAGAIKGGESRYALHPASLDGAIQLGLIACHRGRPNEASTAFVPVQLSHLYLANDVAGDTCTVVTRGERHGIRGAYCWKFA